MKNKSNFSGFLDGYRAQNLMSVSSSLEFHWKQMSHEIISFRNNNANFNVDNLDYISKKIFTIEELQYIGEAIKTFLSISVAGNRQALDAFMPVLYHFFEMAELTGDTTSLNIALEIGEITKNEKPTDAVS